MNLLPGTAPTASLGAVFKTSFRREKTRQRPLNE